MDLHEQLRELVAHHGPSVAGSVDGFRAALDDFLDERDATTGELNLLVDAVRLGAVRRLLEILDHGAEPSAAVHEAGDALARDRGTDDPVRSRWAVAMMGYALGRLESGAIPMIPLTSDPTGASVPGPGPSPAPSPAPSAAPGAHEVAEAGPTREVPVVAGPVPAVPAAVPDGTDGSDGPGRRPGSGRPWLRFLVVALVAGVAAVAWSTGLGPLGREPGDPAGSPGADGATSARADDRVPLPSSSLLTSVTDSAGASRIVAVDTGSGVVTDVTEGPDDRLPVLSPDRETVLFLRRESETAPRPYVTDPAGGEPRPLFGAGDPCDHSGRPAWDLAGERLAVMCTDADGDFVGLHVVDPDGGELATVPLDGEPKGSPTWIAESMLVYARAGEAGAPSSLQAVDLDTGAETPLTTGAEGWDSHPDWSEDSGLLLFSRSVADQFYGELWTLGPAGAASRLEVGRPVAHPVWGPGGSTVAFTVRTESGAEVLAVTRTDDPAGVRLLEIAGDPGVPVWASR